MRTYPCNSPQAAARIVALAMLADGQPGKAELDMLEHLGAHERLGLQAGEFHVVVHDLCDDLLCAVPLTWADACLVDPRTLAHLLAELDDRALRLEVLRLCIAAVEADGQVGEGASIMLVAAVEHWGLHREMLQPELAQQVVEHA